jgi:hypothetical protein
MCVASIVSSATPSGRKTTVGAPMTVSRNSSLGSDPSAVVKFRRWVKPSTSPSWESTDSPIETSDPMASMR